MTRNVPSAVAFAESIEAANRAAAETPAGTGAVAGFYGPTPDGVTDDWGRAWQWYAVAPIEGGWAGATPAPTTYLAGRSFTRWGAQRGLRKAYVHLLARDRRATLLLHLADLSGAGALLAALATTVVAIASDPRSIGLAATAWALAGLRLLARRRLARRLDDAGAPGIRQG